MWEWQTESDGHGQIDSAIDPNQEYICFIWSKTLPSACYFSAKRVYPFTLRV